MTARSSGDMWARASTYTYVISHQNVNCLSLSCAQLLLVFYLVCNIYPSQSSEVHFNGGGVGG